MAFTPIQLLKDPKFFLESFTKIKSKDKGIVPFKLWPHQLHYFNALRKKDRIIINKARQLGFCLKENSRVLMADLTWREIKDVKPGEEVVAVDEELNLPRENGFKSLSRKMRTATVEAKFEYLLEAFEIDLDDGRKITATAEHRFLSKKTGHRDSSWVKVKDMKVGQPIRWITKPWDNDNGFEDGWAGGLYDGEGSFRHSTTRTGAEICVSQVYGKVLDRARKYLDDNSFHYREDIDDRKPGLGSKLGKKTVVKLVSSRMDEIFRFLGKTRPTRFINQRFWEGKDLPGKGSGIGWTKVISIKPVGLQRMIDLQTSCRTYIAEGLVSHNSAATAGYALHQTITNPGFNALILSYDAEQASEILEKMKLFLESMPDELKPSTKIDNKRDIVFDKLKSQIKVIAAKDTMGRGYTSNFVHCSEVAFWDNAEERMGALMPSVAPGGKIVIESTPESVGSYYHRLWSTDDNGWEKLEYGPHWLYSEEFLEQKRREYNDPVRFAREFLLQFTTIGRTVFDQDVVKDMRKNIWEVGKQYQQGTRIYSPMVKWNGLTVFKDPEPGEAYCMGIDVSEGKGEKGDYAVIVIFNRYTGEEVAFWRGKVPPDVLGERACEWGLIYNRAMLVPEVNNQGLTTLTIIKQKAYPNIYFRPREYDKSGQATSDRIGWKTTTLTKPMMISDFDKMFRNGEVLIHSKETLNEMMVYVYDDGGHMNAMSGHHDDAIMSTAIALQGFKMLAPTSNLQQIDYKQYMPDFGY